MTLEQLISALEEKEILAQENTAVEIKNISYHSRKVTPGSLFVCIRGFKEDGGDFVAEAIERGAVALLGEAAPGRRKSRSWLREERLPRVIVPNSRRALALLSAEFYGHPSEKLKLVGVTGTNGKTTTTYLLESILKRRGYRVGLLGTIIYRMGIKVEVEHYRRPHN